MGIEFFCGITGDTQWNHHPVSPGNLACVSPVYGRKAGKKKPARVFVPDDAVVLQDSGAFSDNWSDRLTFESALDRQIEHAERFQYANKIVWRVAYDLLIDETWVAGERHKRRWTIVDAEEAVSTTVQAARYLAYHRNNLRLILPAQGVDADQYFRCAKAVIEYLEPEDALGLGGWCILGIQKGWMPIFAKTLHKVIPYAAQKGVKNIHIFGVIYPKALGWLLWMCNQYDLQCSTDSMSPSLAPTRGEWGYGDWRDKTYSQPPTDIRGLERARHVALTRNWLANLEQTKFYRQPPLDLPEQLSLFEVF